RIHQSQYGSEHEDHLQVRWPPHGGSQPVFDFSDLLAGRLSELAKLAHAGFWPYGKAKCCQPWGSATHARVAAWRASGRLTPLVSSSYEPFAPRGDPTR